MMCLDEKKSPKKSRNIFPKKVGNKYMQVFSYAQCIKSKDGFIDAKRYLPFPGDLVFVIIERKGEKLDRIYPGWWTGQSWDGAKIKDSDIILYWKRKEEHHDFTSD